MKFFYAFSLAMLVQLFHPLAADDMNPALECTIVMDDIEKVVCTVHIDRTDYDRNVTFFWHSRRYAQDDRERTVVLRAQHSSVYDYRFLRGRAQGEWSVSATVDAIDSKESVETNFLLEGNSLK